jgi:hypothetical protein
MDIFLIVPICRDVIRKGIRMKKCWKIPAMLSDFTLKIKGSFVFKLKDVDSAVHNADEF